MALAVNYSNKYYDLYYYYDYYIRGLRIFSHCEDVAKDRNTRGTSSTDCRERGSHARSVYPTQYASRMGTATVKEEVGADTRIIVKWQYEIWKEGTWAL